ncbi:MAG: phosphatidate cytidylyltransferase [Bacillota bacterium]
MLWQRVISAIIGILVIVFFIYWGSLPFAMLVLAASVIAVIEYDRMLPREYKNNNILLAFYSLIIILYTYLSNRGVINISLGLFFTVILFTLFVLHIFNTDIKNFLERLGYNLLGVIYLGGGFTFFILLRDFNIEPFTYTSALWLALIATWAEDTGAYFIGKKFGKTNFFEKSPNKTIEGVFGGILLTVIAVSIYTYILGAFSLYWISYSVMVAVIAMLGDFFESSIKRAAGVKDSGHLIPGHGGVLDRLDSLLFAIPFTYYFLILVM